MFFVNFVHNFCNLCLFNGNFKKSDSGLPLKGLSNNTLPIFLILFISFVVFSNLFSFLVLNLTLNKIVLFIVFEKILNNKNY